jgi:hypothetical protein
MRASRRVASVARIGCYRSATVGKGPAGAYRHPLGRGGVALPICAAASVAARPLAVRLVAHVPEVQNPDRGRSETVWTPR